jgi:hypothetical protein
MSEGDLLAIGRSATEHLVAWFGQMLTITFAMIVAIYYFLKDARFSLRLFTFLAYTLGMTVLLGVMLVESNIKLGATEALQAMPRDQLSGPALYYLALSHSWMTMVVNLTFNLSVWVLWFGVLYLLFFAGKHWRQAAPEQNTSRSDI